MSESNISAPSESQILDSAVQSGFRLSRDGVESAVIMMVDDEPINTAVVQAYLEDVGYQNFIVTSDSEQALDLLVERMPDCLLLDLVMPGVTGFEILEEARAHPLLEHIPVLILTSSDDSETKLRALELGATDFLAKPVDPSELKLRLRNTLAAKAYQDRLIFHDLLTGLPNRRRLMEQIDVWLSSGADDTEVALLRINLDRFKGVNDTLGHAAGDLLLKAVSDRMVATIQTLAATSSYEAFRGPMFARTGGDEFALLLPGKKAGEAAGAAAEHLLRKMREPLSIQGHEVYVTLSIGISVWPDNASSAEALLANANIAMTAAKELGRNRAEVFNEELRQHSIAQLSFESELRRAIERDQLELHYQPKVEVDLGGIIGVEALLRWRHPEYGLVSPGRFIPLAEETGLIVEMGNWVIGEACRQSHAWQQAGLGDLRVALNISPKQFTEQDLLQVIEQALNQSGADRRLITVEVTESMLLGDVDRGIERMHGIKDMGLRLSIDDFGTGYSSFTYLKQFPLDELKIDRSFVMDLESSESDEAIVEAITAMGHALGLEVVAEGVETEGQLALLQKLGCDIYQGFLFSKPVPAQQILSLGDGRRVA